MNPADPIPADAKTLFTESMWGSTTTAGALLHQVRESCRHHWLIILPPADDISPVQADAITALSEALHGNLIIWPEVYAAVRQTARHAFHAENIPWKTKLTVNERMLTLIGDAVDSAIAAADGSVVTDGRGMPRVFDVGRYTYPVRTACRQAAEQALVDATRSPDLGPGLQANSRPAGS